MTKKTGVKHRRLLFAKNLILMLVMLVVIFLAVYAWYSDQHSVTASSISMSASNPDDIEIAVEKDGKIGNYVTNNNVTSFSEGTWSREISFRGPFKFSTDVTSDGSTFIIPAFSSTEDNQSAKDDARTNGKIVNPNGVPTTQLKTNLTVQQDDDVNYDYVKIPFYLRSQQPRVYIRPTAYLAMAAEEGVQDANGYTAITGNNIARKSAYGNFTSDALVAAMRVSIIGGPVQSITNNQATRYQTTVNGQTSAFDDRTFVWVPRPDLFMNIPAGEGETGWTLRNDVTSSSTLSRIGKSFPIGSTFKHSYYEPKYSGNNAVGVVLKNEDLVENTTIAYKSKVENAYRKQLSNGSVPTLGDSKEITEFPNYRSVTVEPITMQVTGNAETADYYVYKFYLNVWIEGTDSEARRAMDTGQFNLFVEFGGS